MEGKTLDDLTDDEIAELAEKIGESVDDLRWFFYLQKRIEEVHTKIEALAEEDLDKLYEKAMEEAQSSPPVDVPLEELLERTRELEVKYQRIKKKLQEVGV